MTVYDNGTYLRRNPTWHAEDASWKASKIVELLAKHGVRVESIADVGCGAGEVLRAVSALLPSVEVGVGYEVSPQAYELCSGLGSKRLRFEQRDFPEDPHVTFDVAMAIDVLEHLENPWSFARRLRELGDHKVIHVPLDLSLQSVIRPRWLTRAKRDVGHLHYFTRETALGVLDDAGYQVVEAVCVFPTVERPQETSLSRAARLPRRIGSAINPDVTARILGGASLLILAR